MIWSQNGRVEKKFSDDKGGKKMNGWGEKADWQTRRRALKLGVK